ncbi:MAG: TonB-dependent receptor [Alphaproteobacteria bacterium]|nr:TonB-dependent receptor [Alphaproteobacteria bacterium]
MTRFRFAALSGVVTGALAAAVAPAAHAAAPAPPPVALDGDIIVTGHREVVLESRPNVSLTRDAEALATTTHIVNPEDALRYFPSILVRKRNVGDTQAPIATRTSGVGASARSLIYADGVLLSALIGNNNTNASPKWGMIAPDAIESVTVLYGPYSAAYAGNSIGAVVEFTTRMPDKLEATANVVGSLQRFEELATKDDYGAWQVGGVVGQRWGRFAVRLAAQQTTSDSQPVVVSTLNRPATPSASGAPLAGAIASSNRLGQPIAVVGVGGLEHKVQDNVSLRASYDVTPNTTLVVSLGRFGNDTESDVASYLRNGAGATVYAGGPFNIGGYAYTIAPSTFSNNIYTFDEEQLMQSVTLNHHGDAFDWRIVASTYDYAQSEQRLPSGALPGAFAGGPGSIARFDGTGWRTLDAKGVLRTAGDGELSFGAHWDQYELANNRFATTDWRSGAAGALTAASRGQTRTAALWVQNVATVRENVRITTGLRAESWKAQDGLNFNAAPALNVRQPELTAEKLSPKLSLEWAVAPGWTARGSVGQAYRFPTVGELYQAVTVGATQTSPNPNLRPESAVSSEWSLARRDDKGEVRLSIFTEDITNALVAQTARLDPLTVTPALPPSTNVSVSFVQNIAKVESRGVELAFDRKDVLLDGLALAGNVTYVDAKTARNPAFPATIGKRIPQLPDWRATLVATYTPSDRWAFTVAGRYSNEMFGTIDNADTIANTYQGFQRYLVVDARASVKLTKNWTAALGVENLNNNNYYLFHPFPQRTATAELKYKY